MKYNNLNEATIHVLGKYCNFLNELKTEYLIIGGWSPFLLNSNPIQHPGTRDVDVLFLEGATPYALENIIKNNISNGYLLSAKHQFQLFELLIVNDHEFVFNIDLMHPKESKMRGMFVDQLDLAVFLDKEQTKRAKAKSIIGPNTDILFNPLCNEEYTITYIDDDSHSKNCTIRLMNELGCILTKAISCTKQKRERDSLDIFLAIKQARNYGKLIDSTNKLRSKSKEIVKAINEIKRAHQENVLFPNIQLFIGISHEEYLHTMESFFADLTV